ncbi:MAG: ATP synthase F1 subunit epsilon [Candidatus Kapabacteria bacterium]|nr:ATP synthase F1 subunit epsilon [Candidatus Kapabacteria bacterium]
MSDHVLNVSIVTPQATAFTGTVLAVTVPGTKGTFQVLYNHAPIISSLEVGIIKLEDAQNHVTYYASRGGFVEVLNNNISIIVNELVDAAAINVADVEADLADASERRAGERSDRDRAIQDQRWAEARLRAARLRAESV